MLVLRSAVMLLLLALTLASPGRRQRKASIFSTEQEELSTAITSDEDYSQADGTKEDTKEDEKSHGSNENEENVKSSTASKPKSKCAKEVELARITERLRLKTKARLRADRRMKDQMFWQGYGPGPQYGSSMGMLPRSEGQWAVGPNIGPMFGHLWAEPTNEYIMAPTLYESYPFMPSFDARMGEQKSMPYEPEPIEPDQAELGMSGRAGKVRYMRRKRRRG